MNCLLRSFCRPIPWISREPMDEHHVKKLQHEKAGTRKRRKQNDTNPPSFHPPDSPNASKNDQSQQHTKNETTVATSSQSQNESLSVFRDPYGIPLEVIGEKFLGTDDEISMMSCSIMRSSSHLVETYWVENKQSETETQTETLHRRITTNLLTNYDPTWDSEEEEVMDDFTRVSI